MLSIKLKFYNIGRRWFSGKNMNKGFRESNFPHIFDHKGFERLESEFDDDFLDTERDEDIEAYASDL